MKKLPSDVEDVVEEIDGDIVDVTYPTKLTTNLLNKLKARKKVTGVPVTTQIRQAVERDLDKEAANAANASGSNASVPQGDWEATLRNVFTDVFHSVPVSVDRARRGKLQDIADQFGFASVEDLLQDLAFRTIESPNSAASFLFSHIEESAIVAAQTDEHKAKNRRNSKTSQAA